ncbi:hypothetical protein SAMN05192539_1005219 [Paraburkholderia diazotrophica]|uniref:Uncharacterized protein n=1 Tax=Paraburkholderia diazotrophica TaxID=667676 RepID=A0A1H6V7Z2_9BURK|nr:hypothetical protein SAMN05192539_1005219 [Paraburkholderia diazotrophica]
MTALNLLAHEIAAMRPDGAIVSSDHDSEWQTDDRNWFEARPVRGFRIRKPHVGEPGLEKAQWVIVKQLEPGRRVKMPAHWRGDGADQLVDLAQRSNGVGDDVYHDIVLGLIYQGFMQRKFQPMSAIYAQADALQAFATNARH